MDCLANKFVRALVLAGAAAVFAGCSGSVGSAAAEHAVTRFHDMLDAGEFDRLYERLSYELKKASKRSVFVAQSRY